MPDKTPEEEVYEMIVELVDFKRGTIDDVIERTRFINSHLKKARRLLNLDSKGKAVRVVE